MTLNYESPVRGKGAVASVVFGSDQGLVGQFNETLADYVLQKLKELAGPKSVWAVSDRMQTRLEKSKLQLQGSFALSNAIGAVTPLVASILSMLQTKYEARLISEVYLYHKLRTDNGIFEQTAPFR